jgi:hypothetical protein
MAKSWNSNLYSRATGSFGFLKITAGIAIAPKAVTRILPPGATNTTVLGMGRGIPYTISVSALTDGGYGAAASAPFTLPPAPASASAVELGTRDVSTGRPSFALSQYSAAYGPAQGNDGQSLPNTAVYHSVLTGVNAGGQWWGVDLGVDYAAVKHVVIKNRGDCCWERLRHFAVWIGQSPLGPRSTGLNLFVDQAAWNNYSTTNTVSNVFV